ncbi:MAG: sugar phosphate isomerase/epimerase [Clostridiales bacterium]|nr:sugar phosphate isomerase/epimerase [Clostridiales bacterium]
MKKSVNYWSFPAGTSVEDGIRMAKRAGFAGVELSMDAVGLQGMNRENAAREARRIAEGEGMALPSLASGLCWDDLLTSAVPERRQRARDNIRRQADMAAEMGAESCLVLAGAVGVDFLKDGAPLLPYDGAYDASLEAFAELAPYAERAGVQLAIENVWSKFLLSPLEMRDFIDKIGSKAVGCYFDVGNVLLTGYPEQWIKILGRRILKVHFKDYRREPGGFNCFVDLLSGDVDFPAVMRAFEAVGYDGWCAAEMIPNYRQFTDQTIVHASLAMDRIFAGE